MSNPSEAPEECTTAPASVVAAEASGKPRSRTATLFNRLYSRQGTLTHKEFMWSALYLLTLGKLIDSIMLVPLDVINVRSPIGSAGFWVKFLVVAYGVLANFIFFFYPLFVICTKYLKTTVVYRKYHDPMLVVVLVFIYTHVLILPKDSIYSYISGYVACVALVALVYFVGKKFSITGNSPNVD